MIALWAPRSTGWYGRALDRDSQETTVFVLSFMIPIALWAVAYAVTVNRRKKP